MRSRRAPFSLPPVAVAILALLVAALGPRAASGTGSEVSGQGEERPTGIDREAVPEGLHELVSWDDLRAVRTFFERVDPIEERSRSAGGRSWQTAEALAAELGGNWDAPYEFVRGAIAYVPYAGVVRGVGGTLRSRAGNSLDQALLLRELLRLRGVRAELVRGRLAWRDAERLLIGAVGSAMERPETRLLWARIAADHWWVEADRDGRTFSLDPSFADGQVGITPGVEGRRLEAPPDDLFARLRVEARLGRRQLGRLAVPTSEAVGHRLSVDLGPETKAAAGEPEAPSAEAPASGVETAAETAGAVGAGGEDAGGREPLDPGNGPWRMRLRLGDRVVETSPVEGSELAGLVIGLRIDYPGMPSQTVDLAWGSRPSTRFAVAFSGGRVGPGRLAASVAGLRDVMVRLAEVEERAWRDMRPPIAYARAVESLRETALEAWRRFVDEGPGALAWIALATGDRLDGGRGGSVLVRDAIRFAAVRWEAPDAETPGRLSVRLEEPAFAGHGSEGDAGRAIQVARGVLESAMVSEILHRVTGAASSTAFDVTLRAAGAGPPLSRWGRYDPVPDAWSSLARAQVIADLSLGFQVIAPRDPIADAGNSFGWWTVAPRVGRTRGWVTTAVGPFQGVADLQGPWRGHDLDLLLLGVQGLHRAVPALVDLAQGGAGEEDDVIVAVCPAAELVAEILFPRLPEGWEPPALAALCGPGSAPRRQASGSR